MPRRLILATTAASAVCIAVPAVAQVQLDRADPTIAEQVLPKPNDNPRPTTEPFTVAPTVGTPRLRSPMSTPGAIVVSGNTAVATAAFAPALVPFLGRQLTGEDLTQLASAVATVARQAGYPFANASIEPQSMSDGILRVSLDEGRIAAVRVVGAVNPLADRLLTDALVTEEPVRRTTLERAILLVGDVAGVTIKESRFVRQDGFGILLVTIEQDRASAYVQLDNRGSAEIGPIRATMLANFRGIAQAGDELRLIAATTPVHPGEFAFLRAAYAAPVDLHGSTLSVSGSIGRANPGGWLKPLDVIGDSVDVAVAYTRPLERSRARSLWAGVELRALRTNQTLLGSTLRDDRIATITGSINGVVRLGPGVLTGEIAMVGGLPLQGVTHVGDARTSRVDGDARFMTWGYTVDWTTRLKGPFVLALASTGQLASRPLLATTEIGVGGPAFGRAYDYAERTGDQGILGSAELRADLGHVEGAIDRVLLYGFVDGGYVDNLRGGAGGGSLLSTGTGARLGHGALDGMVEIAFPLNADRFDTGTRRPRVSFRVARRF
ncbi:ShlB/FhaC/HecB family hemolysin secretion/activation protein [Sphingomonas sp. KR1UV-12]|uniref:ShlB/FhaC/HecB family hemolysin secretion/activation protein n=1 Tax=Sphingomonas aurea TaxID=3063994 RepID=A0ABT9EJ76_9SPHN|nr:ShlB/FhaC/HecB family hemolysin secretion/activation protein [Sphingomonas sp. KR1UV-12]MDP1027012.1 ShlB/FhaC/HecB family hemolysin secretion/activation protein [Sphingomonas sp. KR1UV-12]